MAEYTRVNWKDATESRTTPINAANLNVMDKGVSDNTTAINTINSSLTTMQSSINSHTSSINSLTQDITAIRFVSELPETGVEGTLYLCEN